MFGDGYGDIIVLYRIEKVIKTSHIGHNLSKRKDTEVLPVRMTGLTFKIPKVHDSLVTNFGVFYFTMAEFV